MYGQVMNYHISGGIGGAGGNALGTGGPGGGGYGPHISQDYKVDTAGGNVFINTSLPQYHFSTEELEKWLKPADVGSNQSAAEDLHHPGTGEWFLEDPKYQQWKESPNSFLWLHGISGCGKTILSATVIKTLRDKRDILYFYFTTADDRKKKLADLLCTLISRLSEIHHSTFTILKHFWESHRHGRDHPSNQTLLETLLAMLKHLTTPLYIVLDALDESSETAEILKSVAKIRDGNISQIHLLITSRSEVTEMSNLFNPGIAIHLQGAPIAKDIGSYVDNVLAKDNTFCLLQADMKEKIHKKLTNDTNPMFRLVELQLNQLRQCNNGLHVEQALSRMPVTMNKIYDKILEEIQESMLNIVHCTLGWLMFSARPMTLDEVIDALAVDFQQSPVRFNLQKKLLQPTKLLEVCGSLVSKQEEDGQVYIQLAHASVREYLSDTAPSLQLSAARITGTACQEMIGRTCLAYLCSFDNFKVLNKSPLAEYAACYWHKHVNAYYQGIEFHQVTEQDVEYGTQPTLWDARSWDKQKKSKPQDLMMDSLMELLVADSLQYSNLLQLLGDEGSITPLELCAQYDVVPAIHKLLRSDTEINAPGGKYGSTLQIVASGGHTEIVQMLLDRGADINAGYALEAAAEGGHTETVQMLLDRDADINAGDALEAAARGGHTETVQMLLDRDADINTGNAMWAAADGGHTETVQMLLDKGADINAGYPLRAAAAEGHTKIVQILLDRGADINAGVALCAAARGGHTEIVQMLLDRGADINAGYPLQAAANTVCIEIVQMLLDRGADVNAGYPLEAAAYRGCIEIVQMLLDRGADINAGDPLRGGAIQGHTKIVQMLLDRGAHINAGFLLQEAADGGYTKIVQMLLDKGADINAGYPLQAAANRGCVEIVQMLLDKGADVNAGDPLWKGVIRGDTKIVQMLLDRGADINARFLLRGAANGRHTQIVQMLLDRGADINAGYPLQAAANRGCIKIVQMLLDRGADINAGYALQAAANRGCIEIVQMLLDRGADINAGDPLQAGAIRGNTEIVQMLLNRGADINAGCALQAAANRGHTEIVQMLLDRGAD